MCLETGDERETPVDTRLAPSYVTPGGAAIWGSTRTEDHTSSPSWCSQFDAATPPAVTPAMESMRTSELSTKATAHPSPTTMQPAMHRPELGGVGDAPGCAQEQVPYERKYSPLMVVRRGRGA
jgi:hypothetical protein